jgi:hypothetical protein
MVVVVVVVSVVLMVLVVLMVWVVSAFEVRYFIVHGHFAHETRDIPIPNATYPSLTLPWAPLSLSLSGNCVSRFHNSCCYVFRTPDIPIPDEALLWSFH